MNIFDTIIIAIVFGVAALGVAAIVWAAFAIVNDMIAERQAKKHAVVVADRYRVKAQLSTTEQWDGYRWVGTIRHYDGVNVRTIGSWVEAYDTHSVTFKDGTVRFTERNMDALFSRIACYMVEQGW